MRATLGERFQTGDANRRAHNLRHLAHGILAAWPLSVELWTMARKSMSSRSAQSHEAGGEAQLIFSAPVPDSSDSIKRRRNPMQQVVRFHRSCRHRPHGSARSRRHRLSRHGPQLHRQRPKPLKGCHAPDWRRLCRSSIASPV